MTFPQSAVTRTVPLRFAGTDLRFHLSHALFSSHRIDDGTMVLLKTLAQQNRIPETGRVLDAGCGVGPLAVALKKHRPALHVSARDRLALACAFTTENARINGVQLDVSPGLLLESVEPGWSLLVSNLPAKAGEPVLRDFFQRSLGLLAPDGWAAVVIVSTLADWADSALHQAGAEVAFSEEAPGYRVFHYRRPDGFSPAALPEQPFPQAYNRAEMPFAAGKKAFSQKTFYGLPNFDALDYRYRVSEDALTVTSWKKPSLLVWEPVQGHVATVLASQLPPSGVLHLAGNDLLGLRAAAANLDSRCLTHCLATPGALAARTGAVDGAVFQIHSEPEVPWVDEARQALLDVLSPGAPVLVNGTSTDLARFLEAHKGLRKARDEKYRGWRSVLFHRS